MLHYNTTDAKVYSVMFTLAGQQTPVQGWLEAFAAHPRIGDIEGLRQKFGAFGDLSRSEQSAAASSSSDSVLQELATWNRKYEAKFGHIFIVCASGKPASEILSKVKQRYENPPNTELACAAAQQMQITELRLRKLLEDRPGPAASTLKAGVARRAGVVLAHLSGGESKPLVSPITTHVLDTSAGKPAAGVPVSLHRLCDGSGDVWELVGGGLTNHDGRVPTLLPAADRVSAGTYRITFNMSPYMQQCRQHFPDFFPEQPFYPKAAVTFQILPAQERDHFHVPLTWNPYGYSTYRGS